MVRICLKKAKNQLIQPNRGQTVPMDHRFQRVLIQAGQRRSFEHPVEAAQAFDRGIDVGEGKIRAEEQSIPNAVFLHQHQALVELERAVMQRADVGEHVGMFADRHDALALVRMTQVGEDEPHAGIFQRHRLDEARQGAFQRRLSHERRARVHEGGQPVFLRVIPERRQQIQVIDAESGVHRQQLDAAQAQFFAPEAHFILPAGLGGIHREKTQQSRGILGDVAGYGAVIHPNAGQPGFSAENDGFGVVRGGFPVSIVGHGQIDLRPGLGAGRLTDEVRREVVREIPSMAVNVDDHGFHSFLGPGRGNFKEPLSRFPQNLDLGAGIRQSQPNMVLVAVFLEDPSQWEAVELKIAGRPVKIGRQPEIGDGEVALRIPWRDRVVNRNHSRAWMEEEGVLKAERLLPLKNRSEPNKFYTNAPHAERELLEEPLTLRAGDSFSIGAHGRTAFFWLNSVEELKEVMSRQRPFGGLPGETTPQTHQRMIPPPLGYEEVEGLDDYSLRLQLKLLQQELPEKVLSGWTSEDELLTRTADFLKTALPGQRGVSVAFLALEAGDDGEKPRFEILNQDPSAWANFRVSTSLLRQINLQAPNSRDTYLWNSADPGAAQISDATMLRQVDWVAILPVATLEGEGGIYQDRHGRLVFLYVEARQASSASAIAFVPFLRLIGSVVASLHSARNRQRIQDSLSDHFSPALRRMLHAGDVDQLKPTLAECTVLFCDRRGASRSMESASTDAEILRQLRENQEIVGEISATVFEHDGVITDFAGDGVLALWGWPVAGNDHATHAVNAAESIANRLASRMEAETGGRPAAVVRMGISTGRIAVGDTGPVQQVHISVFGNVVNFGARLELLGKQFQVPALLSHDTMQLMRDSGKTVRKLCYLRPAGFNRAYPVYELVLPRQIGGSGVTDEQIAAYEAALQAFVARNWVECVDLLQKLPDSDGPAHWLREQAEFFQANDPGEGWQGEIASLSK